MATTQLHVMTKAKATKVGKSRNKSSPSKNAAPIERKSEKTERGEPEVGPSVVVDQNGVTSAGVRPPEQQQNESITSPTSGTTPLKRKSDEEAPGSRKKRKKVKQESDPAKSSQHTIRKLAPPRPFPTVPTSVSATGPRSAHVEGKNCICITRKTALGMYLRRCKDVVLKDGYKTLYLSAMGAAIPHLARLVVSLPSALPFSPSDIKTDIRTGTTEVHDEIIPEDEDEDITMRTRGKSTMSITIKIEGGDDEAVIIPGANKKVAKGKGKAKEVTGLPSEDAQPAQLVFSERDLEDDDEDSS